VHLRTTAICVSIVAICAGITWMALRTTAADASRNAASTPDQSRRFAGESQAHLPAATQAPADGSVAARSGVAADGATSAAVTNAAQVATSVGVDAAAGSKAPPVSGMTPQQRAAQEARDTGRYPERLSSNIIKPFDRAAWESDPDSYLNTSEPGRVFATAEPSHEIMAIQRIGDVGRELKRGQDVELAVRVPPGAPVSFNSFDMGSFAGSNRTSITVRADDEGVARVRFSVSPGVASNCRILAGSPFASGQVAFDVDVIEN